MGILNKSAGSRSRPFNKASKAGVGGLALVFGLLLFMLFRPPGTGTASSGTSDGTEGEGSRPALVSSRPGSTAAVTPTPLRTNEHDSSSSTDNEQHALHDNVLTVLIDEHSYLIRLSSGDETVYRPVEMDRLLQLAGRATGDSNGIRVRVIRRESARAAAEENLKQSLNQVGIGSAAVYMSEQFVP